jgi:pyruvate dehydrogenase E1 component alpha subunit
MTEINDREIAEKILRLRISQLLINEEYKAGKFKIPVHLALGHEAIAVAMDGVLEDGDKLVLPHRNAAYNLARLGKLRPILDEYLLKPSGLAGGKLGSMNVINPERGIIYSSSILGNNFPVAAGIAMAEKIKEKNGVVFVLGGDGSMEEGSFYENLVLAKTLGLGLVFVIENNEWSLGTSISERRCPVDIKQMAGSVNIPYLKLEGNHAHRYIELLKGVREEIARGNGPVCVEVTVKTLGDRKADDGHYINYHAGPAPTVDLTKVVLKENEDDPVFVVRQEMGPGDFDELKDRLTKELQDEIH